MSENTKKKVLFLITKGNFGGAQRYIFDLATSLPKSEFTSIVASGEGHALKEKLEKEHIKHIEIKNLGRDIKSGKDFKAFFEILRILKKERPNIVHLNSSKIGFLGSLACRIYNLLEPKACRLKAIFTAHGWPFKEKRSLFFKLGTKFLSWLTVIFSNKTIVVSKDDFKKSQGFYFCKEKIVTIHNGIDSTVFKEGFESKQFLGKHISESFWIGTISELHQNKGLDFLIESFASVNQMYPDSALVIIGDGEEKESLENLASKYGIRKKVYFLGHIKDAPKWLKAFDIFTLTSRKEGLPYALLEAGLAKIPVVTSKVGGIPEIIADQMSGFLIPPGDVKNLSEAIQKLIQEPKLRSEFSQKLYEDVLRDFSFKKELQKTIEVYRN